MEAERLHQRGMGAIGAIVAMVIAGLIVSGIIYYGPSIWGAIKESAGNSVGSGVLSPTEIKQHPEKYLGQTVTVEGWYVTALWSNLAPYNEISPIDPFQVDTSGEAATIMTGGLSVDLAGNTVFTGAKYLFTGVVVSVQDLWQTYPRLNVTRVEPV